MENKRKLPAEPRNPMVGRVAPAGMFIMEAIDTMGLLSISIKSEQRNELKAESGQLQKLGITLPLTERDMVMYELGLQVARALLAQNQEAASADVNI
jgi:hypothetical protein